MNSVTVLETKKILVKHIRSFVHRQAGLSKKRKWALNTLLLHYSPALNKDLLDLEQVFQRIAPTILEIGFGMGHNLLEQAQRAPDKNFLGIEVHHPGIANVMLGIERLKLHNLKIICADAVELLNTCIADKQFDVIQIFFPDPWPKRRHHKRRLIQPEFAKLLQKKLKLGGQLQLATDWQDYAEYMLFILENTAGLKNTMEDKQFSPRLIERSPTKFEKRAQHLGHIVRDLVFYAN